MKKEEDYIIPLHIFFYIAKDLSKLDFFTPPYCSYVQKVSRLFLISRAAAGAAKLN